MIVCRTKSCPLKKVCTRWSSRKTHKGEQHKGFQFDKETGCYFFKQKEGTNLSIRQLKLIKQTEENENNS